MAKIQRYIGVAAGAIVMTIVGALALENAPGHRVGAKKDGIVARGPLISRGYTAAPTGSVVVAGDPSGGDMLIELRIVDGQKIKRGDIIAVLSKFPTADVAVHQSEAKLAKTKQQRESMVSGFRTAQIALQEVVVRSSLAQHELKVLHLRRTSIPADQKELELSISQQEFEREKAKLRVQKERLAADLAQIEMLLSIVGAELDNARILREDTLVRSPIDGVVAQIYARQGELSLDRGIAKIVDLARMRVFADVDEAHLGGLNVGAKVEITFRGNKTIYAARIARAPLVVARTKRSDADFGEVNAPHSVEIEIELDSPAGMPQLLGNEARVAFL
jgi:HlyD family secretion protein